MKYSVITKNLIEISDFFTQQQAEEIVTYFCKPFERKISSDYHTWAYTLQSEDFFVLEKYIDVALLSKIVSKLYKKDLSRSSIGEIVKMEKGDFLQPHTDAFHSLQCVVYLNSLGTTEGGVLRIEDKGNSYTFTPRVGSVLIFRGTCKHSVSEIVGNTTRYVCTFGWK